MSHFLVSVKCCKFVFSKTVGLFWIPASHRHQLFGGMMPGDPGYALSGPQPWSLRTSPGPGYRADTAQRRTSPSFRRTPGASRPASRASTASSSELRTTLSNGAELSLTSILHTWIKAFSQPVTARWPPAQDPSPHMTWPRDLSRCHLTVGGWCSAFTLTKYLLHFLRQCRVIARVRSRCLAATRATITTSSRYAASLRSCPLLILWFPRCVFSNNTTFSVKSCHCVSPLEPTQGPRNYHYFGFSCCLL